MTDLGERFRSLDRVPVPDLWDEIESRAGSEARVAGSVVRAGPMFRHRRTSAEILWWVIVPALLLAALVGAALIVASERDRRDVVSLPVPSEPPPAYTVVIPEGATPRNAPETIEAAAMKWLELQERLHGSAVAPPRVVAMEYAPTEAWGYPVSVPTWVVQVEGTIGVPAVTPASHGELAIWDDLAPVVQFNYPMPDSSGEYPVLVPPGASVVTTPEEVEQAVRSFLDDWQRQGRVDASPARILSMRLVPPGQTALGEAVLDDLVWAVDVEAPFILENGRHVESMVLRVDNAPDPNPDGSPRSPLVEPFG